MLEKQDQQRLYVDAHPVTPPWMEGILSASGGLAVDHIYFHLELLRGAHRGEKMSHHICNRGHSDEAEQTHQIEHCSTLIV